MPSPGAPSPSRPSSRHPDSLGAFAVSAALGRGFAAAGVLAAGRPETWNLFGDWLEQGYHGEMTWLERDAEARRDFSSVLPGCASVLSVALAVPGGGEGNVARYARGEDYHEAVRSRLKLVIGDLRSRFPGGTRFRACVDTAPLLEREIASRAGVGFIGRNGMLIVPGIGSHVVLGELLTDAELVSPAEVSAFPEALDFQTCGACRACIDGCPTQAFIAPPFLDARRCLSYLTIEKRGALSERETDAIAGRLFGCDVCQDVCPWNAAGSRSDVDPSRLFPPAWLDPAEVVSLDADAFRRRFFRTAIWRATPDGLARNARAALSRRAPL